MSSADPAALTPPKRLAVSLFTSVLVLDRSYKVLQTITNGVSAAHGLYYDLKGNLYVANGFPISNASITEYNKAGTLVSTYTTDLTTPFTVTVDASGNVYVPDANNGKAGVVVEYPQGSNAPIVSCNTGLSNAGVAIDGNGNVFVSGNVPGEYANQGTILEYSGGLSGCNATKLGVAFAKGIGSVDIDKRGNLLAVDGSPAGIDIIPPPYAKIRKTITGAGGEVMQSTLNERQNLIYIANNEYGNPTVAVDKYPSGANVTTLGAMYGITYASEGVAAYR